MQQGLPILILCDRNFSAEVVIAERRGCAPKVLARLSAARCQARLTPPPLFLFSSLFVFYVEHLSA